MNKELFAKQLVLPVLVGAFVVGCASTASNAPVRDSKSMPASKAASKQPPPPVEASPVARAGEHVVRRGETLYAVSRLYDVPVQSLIAWNNLSRPEQLEVGQILRVAAPGAVAEPLAQTGTPVETANLPEIKREPRGGKEAWSEEAWARLNPQTAATVSSTPDPTNTPPKPSASENWMWPVKGTIIGRFDEPTGSDGKTRNRGVDIAGASGTPVLAAASGSIAYAGNVRGYGNMVIIRHNDEYLTAYAHNRVILVQVGNTVTKGQKIAELGSSDTERPMLHFELRKQGVPVDPLKYLPDL
jgi:lipoprotein NlpD